MSIDCCIPDNIGGPNDVHVQSLVALKTREPIVSLYYKDAMVQMSPDEARSLALNILSAAEASEQDAFMLYFATEKIKSSVEEAAVLVAAFRAWREKK